MATLQERITDVVTAIGTEIKKLKGVQTDVEAIAGKVLLLEQCCEELKNQAPAPQDPNTVKEWTDALNLIKEDRPQLTAEEQKTKTRRWVVETYKIKGSKHYIDLHSYIDSVRFTIELDFIADKATVTGEEGTVVWISDLNQTNKNREVGRIGPDNKLEVDISTLPYSTEPYQQQSNYTFIYNNPLYGNYDNRAQINIGLKKNYYDVVTSLEGKAYFQMNNPTGFTVDKFKQYNPNFANMTQVSFGGRNIGSVNFMSPDDYLPFQFSSGSEKYATVNLVPFKFKWNNISRGYVLPHPSYGTVLYTEDIDPNKNTPFISDTFDIGDSVISGNSINVYIKCDYASNAIDGIRHLHEKYLSREGWNIDPNMYGTSVGNMRSYGFLVKRPFNKAKFNSMTVGSYDDDMRIKKVSDTEIDLYLYKGVYEEEQDFFVIRLNLLDPDESYNEYEYFSLNNKTPFYAGLSHSSSYYY